MAAVKSGRLSRSDRARQTRRRMLGSARDLFVAQGYTATTMERIADEAGVAVQTLYYSFGTKGQLLCEVVEVTAAGEDDAVPVAQRPWMQEMLAATSGPRVLALTVEHGADIFVRAAPLWPAVAAATADPDVDRYWNRVAAGRRGGQARMVARLADLGALRDGLTPHRATDIVGTLFGHDVFRSLVSEATWSVPEYKAWLLTTLAQQLLRRRRLPTTSFSDLSYAPLVAST
jgi:TetR/AcrR family transcriptional regulator of autoinduction and epiphytic fitness